MPLTDSIPERYLPNAIAVAKAIPAMESVVAAAHVNLDGDALGSLAACAVMLRSLGKDVVLMSSTGVPDFLSFFPLPAPLVRDVADIPFTAKSAFLLDCGVFTRVGGSFRDKAEQLPRINVDHHEGTGIGTLATWVEPLAASTTQLMAYVALALGLPLEGPLADAIALGLITDTGGFSHSNTSAEVFDLCALLVRNGCNIAALRESLDSNMRYERMRLWARLANKVSFLKEGRIALCTITQEDFSSCNATKDDSEGFVEYMLRLKGVSLSALVRENSACECKFSLRSVPAIDVWAIANKLNGGGHRNAAGGTLTLPLDEAVRTLTDAIAEHTF